jgi:hypothetical protein
MDALGQQFNDTVEKLKASINPDTQKPYTEQEAYDAAGDAILQGGLLDGTESTIGGTDQSGVSVSGKPSETDTRVVDTTGGNLGAAGATTTATGGGEGTELNTLTAEIKAKYPQMTDAQATAAATESLRQKQIAAGSGTTPAGSVTPTVPSREEIKSGPILANIPQKLIDLQNKMDEADAKAEGYNAGSLKRNATMAFRRYSDATQEYLKPYLTGDKDADQTLWMRFTDLLSEKAREIKETPAGTTATRGKSPGRPKTDKTPEQIAAAAEYRRQRQAIGRNASAEVDKVEKVLNRVVDEQAIIDNSGTEKEAQDTLYELRQERIDALSVAYGLSVDPNQKKKTAGTRAAAAIR